MANTPKLVVAAVIVRPSSDSEDNGKGALEILICQRAADGPMPLKWEFPGGKVEPDEDPKDALRRELREELSIEAVIGRKLAVIRHEYKNGFFVELLFYAVDRFKGEITNNVFADVRWDSLSKLSTYDFLEADVVFIRDLAAGRIPL